MDCKSEEYNVILKMCWCCMSQGSKDLCAEYYWMNEKEIYLEMLMNVFNLTIPNHGGADKFICEVCITRLRNACIFKKQVIDTLLQLEKFIYDTSVNPLADVKCENMVVIEDEVTYPKSLSINEDNYSENNGILEHVKLEVSEHDEDDVEEIPKSRPARRKLRNKAITSGVAAAVPSSSKDKKVLKGFEKGDVRDYKRVRERQNRDAATLVRHSNILIFRWRNNKYMCFCCKETFLNISPLRQHTAENHKTDSIIMEIHNRYNPALPKADITSLVCVVCDRPLDDLKTLTLHLHEAHSVTLECFQEPLIPYKLTEPVFQCQMCEEKFEVFKKLNTHMNKHFGVFICCTCGAGFQHEFALKCHERRHAPSAMHTCEKCNLNFANAYKKLVHVYAVHKNSARYGCPQCSEKFMDYYKRLTHLAKVHGVERPGSNCRLCEKTFKNDRFLRQHVRYVHLNERNHVCAVCGNRYFSKSELRKHLAGHK